MSSLHSCLANNCVGSKLNGLFLCCRHCHEKVYVECMLNKNETLTTHLLKIFSILVEEPKGTKNLVCSESKYPFDAFKAIFNVDSPFGISCPKCDDKLINYIGNSDTFMSSLQNEDDCTEITPKSIVMAEQSHYQRPAKQLRAPESRTPQQLRNPEPVINEGNHDNEMALKIHVSKFHPETECMDIAHHINQKTSLIENEHFSVAKLGRKLKYRNLPLTFVSFLITASSKDAYDTILSDGVWDQFVATAFEKRDNVGIKQKVKTGKHVQIASRTKEPPKQKNSHKKPRSEQHETVQPKKKHRSEHKTSSKSDEKQHKKKSKGKKEKSVSAKQNIPSNPDFLGSIRSSLDQHQLILQLLLKQMQQPQTSTNHQCSCHH